MVEHFENRTENSIKNRFYSTLRRIATEHKRNIERQNKINTKKRDKKMLSKHEEEKTLPKSGNDKNSDFYLENPQIAKTEELLKFLPIVIEKLSAYQPEYYNETRKECSNDDLNKKKNKRKNARPSVKSKLEKNKDEELQKEFKSTKGESINSKVDVRMPEQ